MSLLPPLFLGVPSPPGELNSCPRSAALPSNSTCTVGPTGINVHAVYVWFLFPGIHRSAKIHPNMPTSYMGCGSTPIHSRSCANGGFSRRNQSGGEYSSSSHGGHWSKVHASPRPSRERPSEGLSSDATHSSHTRHLMEAQRMCTAAQTHPASAWLLFPLSSTLSAPRLSMNHIISRPARTSW